MCCLLICRMNFKGLFQELNPSKFLVYFTLVLFVVLLGTRLDRFIEWSYFIVFLPLWIWKLIVLSGSVIGIHVWIHHPEYRRENSVDFQAMLVSTGFHLLLVSFEIMLCLNMDRTISIPYRLVFIPMFCLSGLSIAGCMWGFRHERQLELETFFSVNVLQFICLSLKFDEVINWSWVVVFVPIWIILTLLSVVVLYYIVWALLFMRSPDITPAQRKAHLVNATMSFLMVIPLLAFVVMLSQKLDGDTDAHFSTILIPLELSLLSLIVTSFYQKGGNQWWFGMRKEFCEFLLDICPCLREYGNVSYKISDTMTNNANHDVERSSSTTSDESDSRIKKSDQKPVASILFIDIPD